MRLWANRDVVWSTNSNGLNWRGLGFAQALCLNGLLRPGNSSYNLAFTKLEITGESKMLWARLLAYCQRNSKSRTLIAKRISDGGEPDPERPDQGSVTAFGRRKGDTGRDRSPPGSKGAGGRGGYGQARYDSGLVSEAHREQI